MLIDYMRKPLLKHKNAAARAGVDTAGYFGLAA